MLLYQWAHDMVIALRVSHLRCYIFRPIAHALPRLHATRTSCVSALSLLCGQCAATVLAPTAAAGSVQQSFPTLEVCDAITTLCQTMLQKLLWVIQFHGQM